MGRFRHFDRVDRCRRLARLDVADFVLYVRHYACFGGGRSIRGLARSVGFAERRSQPRQRLLVRQPVAQRRRRVDHRDRIHRRRTLRLQRVDPFRETGSRQVDQFVQRCGPRTLFGEPQVQHLLHRPGGVAESLEPDHPARSFQRVESAADRDQQRVVGRRGSRIDRRRFDGLQHFLRLAEEDLQQLAVDLGFFALRLVGNRRFVGSGSTGNLRDRGPQRPHVQVAVGVDARDRLFGVRLERGIVDQVRVVADLRERAAQRVARLSVVGAFGEGNHELARALRVLRHERLRGGVERYDDADRIGPRFVQDRVKAPRLAVELETRTGAARLLQAFDEETKGTDAVGDRFATLDRRRLVVGGEGLHLVGHRGSGRCRILVSEQLERTRNLMQLAHRLRQVGALRRVAKERVERLFGRTQVALRLDDERRHRQPLLRRVADVAQPLRHLVVRRRARRGLHEARGHFGGTRVVVVLSLQPALEDLFGEQQRRGGLERQRLGQRLRVEGEQPGRFAERVGQRANAGKRQRSRGGTQRGDRLCEGREVGSASARELFPRELRARYGFLRIDDRTRVDAPEARRLEILGNRARQTERAPHLRDERRERRMRLVDAREREQRVLEQPLGNRRTVGERAAQLQVQPREQALAVDVQGKGAVAQRLEPR